MELDEKEVFDGAIFGNKKFPFVTLTVTKSEMIIKELLPSRWQITKNIISRSGVKKRWWIKIRSIAFEKSELWKIGIVPKELRCSVIPQKKAEEIEDNFFVYAEEIVKEYERLLSSSNPSLTVNSKVKLEV